MIILIGTGHVFDLSQPLLHIFDEKQPDIICVELDKQRYHALMKKQQEPLRYKKAMKNAPFVYRILARFQNNMAKQYGVEAGDEMITAINYARDHQKPIAFIDMNAQHMFTKMLKEMTLKEKFKLLFSGIGGIFVRKKRVEKELKKFEGDFDKYIEQIGDKLPTIKRVLIDQRNQYMLNHLKEADEKYDQVLAVIGDGHIPGLIELLEDEELVFETIRLKDLRKQVEVLDTADKSTASISLEYTLPDN